MRHVAMNFAVTGVAAVSLAAMALGGCASGEPVPDDVTPKSELQGRAAPVAPAPRPVDWETLVHHADWTPMPLSKRKGIYHVLDIDSDGERLVAATFGKGFYLSIDGGRRWRQFDKPKRAPRRRNESPQKPLEYMKSNYLGGIDLAGDDLWVRSIGHGFGVMRLRDRTWQWWSSRQLQKEYLFPTGFSKRARTVEISTTDGVWTTTNRGRQATKRGPAEGLPSEYVLGLARVGADGAQGLRGQWLGLLQGLYHVPMEGAPRMITAADGLPTARVDGVRFEGGRLWALTNAGVAWSADGQQWQAVGEREGLPSGHVYDVAVAADGKAWVGTANGLAQIDPDEGKVKAVAIPGPDPRRRQVNAVHIDANGRLLAGTTDGLWVVAPSPAAVALDETPACEPGDLVHERGVGQWPRPIAAGFNRTIDQTYMFGQTWGGQFGVHKGIEFNNAEGTDVVAVAPGEVVFADKGPSKAQVVIVRHDDQHAGHFVYSLYIHLSAYAVQLGDRVKAGDKVGEVGHTGPATNDHLHFEVRLSKKAGNGLKATSHNPALFLAPMPGRGVIAGTVRRKGKRPGKATIYGPVVPEPQENPFGFFEIYGKRTYPDPATGEDFAIIDVPPGVYPVEAHVRGKVVTQCVRVEAGKLAWVEFE